MFVVVAYDIADDRRRTRVANILEDYGDRVQESVFEMILDATWRYDALFGRLEAVMEPGEDTIRCYRLCRSCVAGVDILGLGKVTQDEDVIVL